MKNSRIIPVCIVGAGFGKRVLLPICEKHPKLKVVSLVVKENIPKDLASGISIFTDLEEAFKKTEPEMVIIASPHIYHERQVEASIDAGKHVLCEKPLAMNFIASNRLLHKCLKKGVVGSVDYSFRFIPARAYFGDLIERGIIGTASFIRLSFFRDDFDNWPSRWYYEQGQGGGMVLATGSHLIDSAQRLLSSEIINVSATIHFYNDIDVGFDINLEAKNGAVCVINVSHKITGTGKHLIEARGTAGSLFLNQDGSLTKVSHGVSHQCLIPANYYFGFNGRRWIGEVRLQPVARVISDIVLAITESEKFESTNFADAVKNQRIIDAVWKSHGEGRRVYIEEV